MAISPHFHPHSLFTEVLGSIPGDWMWDSWCAKWHWTGFLSEFFQVFLANPHSTIASYTSVTVPKRRAVALTRQHIITSVVFKLGASSLSRHLAGHRWRKSMVWAVFFSSSVGNFTTVSEAKSYSVEWMGDWWMLNWKGFGRKGLLS
jgi:hypothetical protein